VIVGDDDALFRAIHASSLLARSLPVHHPFGSIHTTLLGRDLAR
jgi:hypothetical protein